MNTVVEDPTPLPQPPTPSAGPQWAQKVCANCGAPMHGPYCYACGQPEKGMIRQLASVMHDVLDTVFNIDSRVFRSLLPLYFRPGYLTLEYFAGRRVRYVTPFRLFFFLCIVAFFAIQIALNLGDEKFTWNHGGINGGDVNTAQTVADVEKRSAAELSGIDKALVAPNMPAGTIDSLKKAREKIQKRADDRLAYLKARDDARAKGEKPPPDPNMEDEGEIQLDGKTWDPATHPLKVSWLPDFANAEFNDMLVRAKENITAAKKDPRRLIEAVFSRLPWTLGLLMPLFAVLLKIVYIFKRRLYMEHLMVALHSHAFIFMSLLLLAILAMLKKWALASAPGVEWLISLLRDAVWIWLPIYLFLMQKRVYRQGWIMTTIKYSIVGICYTIIITFGIVGALLASLALA
jgi:hypothetical protein